MSEAFLKAAVRDALAAGLAACPDRIVMLDQMQRELPAFVAKLHPDADQASILRAVEDCVAEERARA